MGHCRRTHVNQTEPLYQILREDCPLTKEFFNIPPVWSCSEPMEFIRPSFPQENLGQYILDLCLCICCNTVCHQPLKMCLGSDEEANAQQRTSQVSKEEDLFSGCVLHGRSERHYWDEKIHQLAKSSEASASHSSH